MGSTDDKLRKLLDGELDLGEVAGDPIFLIQKLDIDFAELI